MVACSPSNIDLKHSYLLQYNPINLVPFDKQCHRTRGSKGAVALQFGTDNSFTKTPFDSRAGAAVRRSRTQSMSRCRIDSFRSKWKLRKMVAMVRYISAHARLDPTHALVLD